MKANKVEGAAPRAPRVPPFLKKLAELTKLCPVEAGEWSEDETQFVVKSSKFADMVRDALDITIETFVRQLHYYSFKRTECAAGQWTFSHPNFKRGRPELLTHIQRKGTQSQPTMQKKTPLETKPGEDALPAIHASFEKLDSKVQMILTSLEKMDGRIGRLETHLSAISILVQESANLKQQVQALERCAAAENLLSLGPEIKKDRGVGRESTQQDGELSHQRRVQQEITMNSTLSLPPASKIMRMADCETNLGNGEPNLFPGATHDFLLSDFDEIMARLSTVPFPPYHDGTAALEIGDPTVRVQAQTKDSGLNIPDGFQRTLTHGVTIQLVKHVYGVIQQKYHDCESQPCTCSAFKKKMSRELPHPSALGPVETCQLGQEMLPLIRGTVDESTTDLTLKYAIRYTYDLCSRMKRLERASSKKGNITSCCDGNTM